MVFVPVNDDVLSAAIEAAPAAEPVVESPVKLKPLKKAGKADNAPVVKTVGKDALPPPAPVARGRTKKPKAIYDPPSTPEDSVVRDQILNDSALQHDLVVNSTIRQLQDLATEQTTPKTGMTAYERTLLEREMVSNSGVVSMPSPARARSRSPGRPSLKKTAPSVQFQPVDFGGMTKDEKVAQTTSIRRYDAHRAALLDNKPSRWRAIPLEQLMQMNSEQIEYEIDMMKRMCTNGDSGLVKQTFTSVSALLENMSARVGNPNWDLGNEPHSVHLTDVVNTALATDEELQQTLELVRIELETMLPQDPKLKLSMKYVMMVASTIAQNREKNRIMQKTNNLPPSVLRAASNF